MKNLILIIITLTSFSAFSQTELVGEWNTGEDNTIIEILTPKNQAIGKVKSSDNPKAEIGKTMLKDIKKKGNNWTGKIYAAKREQWYDVTITSKGNTLELAISVGFFSKTLEWKKG